ncbi:lysis system i-spanin subunit Rz [Stutzerimonas stutzeri]|uniref:lysis system i-spanin subunit Rz n=1 Tax=Stutzerimonas stutzeri TaxID=316 RepID=UPI001BCAE907|nr:lysis system i-spanin subunit Rz [Stutzerimonas stutzeri]
MITVLKQYKLAAAGLAVLVLCALSFGAAWQWQGNAYGKRLADKDAEHQAFLRQVAEANAAVIRQQQAGRQDLERRLAAADQQSTEKLTHALTENDRLERLYSSADDERRRLRIEVRVANADATVSSTTGAGRVGDAASVELSAAAGSAVWDIRRGMIGDQEKLAYLQQWARAVRAVNAEQGSQ